MNSGGVTMTTDEIELLLDYAAHYEFYAVCITVGVLLNAGFNLYRSVFGD